MLVQKLAYVVLFLVSLLVFAQYKGASTISAASLSTNCQQNDRNQGLISGLSVTGTFGNLGGQCVLDPKAAYAVFKVPTYDEFKSIFYTQAKTTATLQKPAAYADLNLNGQASPPVTININTNKLFMVTGNLTYSGTNSLTFTPVAGENVPSHTAIFFVDGSMTINSDINYGSDIEGLVFVVKGDIKIMPAVKNINAVLISEGAIYTGYDISDGNAANYISFVQPLVINGSLISINQSDSTKKIYFNRSLNDNTKPSETVRFQSKYLAIMRGLMTQTYSIQREIGSDEIPGALPNPTVLPSPVATTPPGGSDLGNPLRVYTIYNLLKSVRI